MSPAGETLIKLIREEIELLRELAEVSREKTVFLSESDLEGIQAATERELSVKSAMDQAEKKLKQAVDETAAFFNMDQNTTISRLAEVMEEAAGKSLKENLLELKAAIREYEQINDINMELIKSHLGFLDYMIHTITGSKANHSTYGAKGSLAETESRTIFDNKA